MSKLLGRLLSFVEWKGPRKLLTGQHLPKHEKTEKHNAKTITKRKREVY